MLCKQRCKKCNQIEVPGHDFGVPRNTVRSSSAASTKPTVSSMSEDVFFCELLIARNGISPGGHKPTCFAKKYGPTSSSVRWVDELMVWWFDQDDESRKTEYTSMAKVRRVLCVSWYIYYMYVFVFFVSWLSQIAKYYNFYNPVCTKIIVVKRRKTFSSSSKKM